MPGRPHDQAHHRYEDGTSIVTEAPEPSAASAPPARKASVAIRFLWWCNMLMATLGGPLIFLLLPVFLLAVGAAFIVAVDSATDRELSVEQRLIGALLSASTFATAAIGAYVADSLGFFGERFAPARAGLAIGTAILAASALMWVRPRVWAITKQHAWKS